MLKYDELWITVKEVEAYNSRKNEFSILYPDTTIKLKHSLISIAKWEHKWHKPFLNVKGRDEKTPEMVLDYIKCMTLNSVPDGIYNYLTESDLQEIHEYIENPMTATTFYDPLADEKPVKPTPQSAETIYADMVLLNIPVEFQKWHLNSLLTLIKVCSLKQQPPKKMSPSEQAMYYNRIRQQKNAAKARKH